MGIMGTGSIGAHVARTAAALDIEVIGLNSNGRDVTGFARCHSTADRLAFAQGLDYLVALLPETPATDGLVDTELLGVMGEGSLFINAGRGNCVNESDLLLALDKGPLRAAVLDVLPVEPLPASSPLWQVDNLYITSHTAAPTADAAAASVFGDNYRRFIAGQPLKHVVDFAKGY
jgi:phosphoglycerate dehydrogenase-like enzyme